MQDPPPARLVIVIDTEEEFDWDKPFDRTQTSVTHMDHIDRIQDIFDRFAARPVYVCDYAVARQDQGFAPLKEFRDQGRAVIGAHLHPWVTPPHDEVVSTHNSYPGNLPRDLEAQKLRQLSDQIETSFGARPTIYKAGRYGLGPNTFEILEEQGYDIDLSPYPPMDLRGDSGPDYRHQRVAPFRFGTQNQLLCIPNSGAFVGIAGALGPALSPLVYAPALQWSRISGIAARLGLLERIRLSPESSDLADLIKLTRWLLARGTRTFVISFHSPNVAIGHTPYVRSDDDLKRFLDKVTGYLDFFVNDLKGTFATPHEIKELS